MIVRKQVVELLLSDGSRARAAAQALSESSSWPAAIALSETWKVVPALSAAIQSHRVDLPADATRGIRQAFLLAYAQSKTRALGALAALHALEQAGIAAAAFKGVASMAVLYGGPKYRTIGDGDLLIERKHLASALACLEAKGFRREGSETLAQYLNFVENAPRFAGNQALALYADDGSEIDLHWELAGSGLSTETILDRSVEAELLDKNIRVVNAEVGFLLNVHHAIREDLEIGSVCRDLLDVALWCRHLEDKGRVESAMEWVARSGARVGALAVTGLLAE